MKRVAKEIWYTNKLKIMLIKLKRRSNKKACVKSAKNYYRHVKQSILLCVCTCVRPHMCMCIYVHTDIHIHTKKERARKKERERARKKKREWERRKVSEGVQSRQTNVTIKCIMKYVIKSYTCQRKHFLIVFYVYFTYPPDSWCNWVLLNLLYISMR